MTGHSVCGVSKMAFTRSISCSMAPLSKVPNHFRARLGPDQRQAGSISPFKSIGKHLVLGFARRRRPC
jgi:hypothetical protein